MGIEDAKDKKLIYHLTKLDNFDSIVKKGLLPRNTIIEKDYDFKNIANMEIIDRRTWLGLDKYVPFHFHPYSAFDVAVKNEYDASQMIYLCMDRSLAESKGFKILPKHPLSEDECKLYEYKEGFDKIDWETLQSKNLTCNYAKNVKMAECLFDKPIPISWLSSIFVPSNEVKDKVITIMKENNIDSDKQPMVSVIKVWFEY